MWFHSWGLSSRHEPEGCLSLGINLNILAIPSTVLIDVSGPETERRGEWRYQALKPSRRSGPLLFQGMKELLEKQKFTHLAFIGMGGKGLRQLCPPRKFGKSTRWLFWLQQLSSFLEILRLLRELDCRGGRVAPG